MIVATIENGTHEARTKDEALRLVRAAKVNARFFIHAAIDAALPDTPDKYIPGAFRASVQVSRGAAELFIADAFHDGLEKRGAALKIRYSVGQKRWNYEHVKGELTRVEFGNPRIYVYIG